MSRRGHRWGRWAAFLLALLPIAHASDTTAAAANEEELETLIGWLLAPDREMDAVPFRSVIRATTGYKILPLDKSGEADQRVLQSLAECLDALLREIADPAHTIHQIGRINEVSGPMEEILRTRLDAIPGLRCEYPRTTDGLLQRSGYPDLKLWDEASGRVFFLDPKVFREGSERSSFRTFYFEPKRETNKVNADGTHLLIGLSHAGFQDGKWVFTGWKLVDLHAFQVRLKAEFQASNRDLYTDGLLVLESGGN